ncbi:hypothetical protein SALBM311S_01269 [Streptomyces alboniger]
MGQAVNFRDPKAFLMDEPLSNLDAKLRVQMRTHKSPRSRRLTATCMPMTWPGLSVTTARSTMGIDDVL